MIRRGLLLLTLVAASFAAAAGAVAFFQDTEPTYDVVRAGAPPAPASWLRMYSQPTDPSNGTLKYATKNDVGGAAASGRINATTETLAVDLGRRTSGSPAWKKAPNGANAQTVTDVEGRFNRLFTLEVPSDAPLATGQKLTVSVGQEAPSPALSGSSPMFGAVELAAINTAANTEATSAFRGTSRAQSVQLGAGDKRQVNVLMAGFGATTSTVDRIVEVAVTVEVTAPGGGTQTYRVPVTICNHQNANQCP